MAARETAPRTTDDRGRHVQILTAAGTAEWPLAGDRRIFLLAARMRAAASPPLGLRIFYGLVVFVLAIGSMTLSRWFFPGIPSWGHTVFLMCGMFIVVTVAARVRKRMAAPTLQSLLIEEGLCPSCAYNLLGLETDIDGLLQCPECGAAWRADRIRRMQAFAPGARMIDANAVVSLAGAVWAGRDDRGERRPFVHPRLKRELAAAASDDARQRILSARAEIRRSGRLLRWAVAVLLCAPAVAFGVALLTGRLAIPNPLVLSLSMAMGVFAVLGLCAFFGNFCYSIKRVRAAMLRRTLCPSCAAPLESQPPGPDGLTVCPDCLAAWRLPF